MLLRWVLAAVHLFALGVGLGSVWVRARGLRGPLDGIGLRRVLAADSWWGIAAALWIGSGLWRLLAESEKPLVYYMHNHLFQVKMGVLVAVLLLEVRPIAALTRWRRQLARGEAIDTRSAGALARISYLEAALVVLMVIAATGMARGVGQGP